MLYDEQQCLRDVMDSDAESTGLASSAKLFPGELQQLIVPDKLSRLRRENEDLKIKLVKMKTRVKELEKLGLVPRSGTKSCASPGKIIYDFFC